MVHLVRYESLSRIDTLNKVEYFKTSNICMTCFVIGLQPRIFSSPSPAHHAGLFLLF